MIQAILLGMLGLYALEDIRKHRISARYLWILAVFGVGLHCYQKDISAASMLLGAAVGLLVIVMSVLLSGSIGMGDGCILLTTGIFVGGSDNLELLFLSLLYAALFSLGAMVFRRWKRNRELPFVPFLFLGYLTMVLEDVL